MKKNTVYVNLQGLLGDYVQKVTRTSKTGDKAIQKLQEDINRSINVASRVAATKGNCKELWERITSLIKNSGIKNTEYKAYKEIVEAVDRIGYKIAYIVPRKGFKMTTQEADEYFTTSTEDKAELGKVYMLYALTLAEKHKKEFDKEVIAYKDNLFYESVYDECIQPMREKEQFFKAVM